MTDNMNQKLKKITFDSTLIWKTFCYDHPEFNWSLWVLENKMCCFSDDDDDLLVFSGERRRELWWCSDRSSSLISAACGSWKGRLLALCRPAGHTFTRENTSLHGGTQSVSQWRSAEKDVGVYLTDGAAGCSPTISDCFCLWRGTTQQISDWQTWSLTRYRLQKQVHDVQSAAGKHFQHHDDQWCWGRSLSINLSHVEYVACLSVKVMLFNVSYSFIQMWRQLICTESLIWLL